MEVYGFQVHRDITRPRRLLPNSLIYYSEEEQDQTYLGLQTYKCTYSMPSFQDGRGACVEGNHREGRLFFMPILYPYFLTELCTQSKLPYHSNEYTFNSINNYTES